MCGAWDTLAEEDRYVEVYAEKSEGKQELGRPARKWEGSIKMDLCEMGRSGMQ
jgi:hypothetical protein